MSTNSATADSIDWTPTSPERTRIFKKHNDFTLAEKSVANRSWIWKYGIEIQSKANRRWVCMPCIRHNKYPAMSYKSKGTQNIHTHLWSAHKIQDPSGKKPKKAMLTSLTDLFALNRGDPQEQVLANKLISRFDSNEFKALVVAWLIDAQLPFRTVEHPGLREIFTYLYPSVQVSEAHLSHQTIHRLVVKQFDQHFDSVKSTLKAAVGKVHIAFDGARSNNRHALFGITAMYLDDAYTMRKVTLGVPDLIEQHTGDNIAAELINIIEAFEIGNKLGYFTLDNASNNDTAMQSICAAFDIDPVHHRVRCMGHVLNLVVKAILYGHSGDAFDVDVDEESQAAHDMWMKTGALGKAHNLVVWIHRSDQLTKIIHDLQVDYIASSADPEIRKQVPVTVVLDNATRWLSQYYMIERLLKLRPIYAEFLIKANRVNHKTPPRCLEQASQLTDKDWATLEAFYELLYDFHTIVLHLQGDGQTRSRRDNISKSYGSVFAVLPAYECLLSKLEDAENNCDQYPDPEQFRINVNLGWQKLTKYYRQLADTPVYYAAIALHPKFRWEYFDRIWEELHPDWIVDAKEKVRQLWDTSYRNLPIPDEEAYEEYLEKHCINPRRGPAADEYTYWLNDVHLSDATVADPIRYWASKRHEYPRLSLMALDVLTVPAMSAECERLFSAVGLMVTSRRHRLDAGTIGLVQTLRSWQRAGIIGQSVKGVWSSGNGDSCEGGPGEDIL